MQNNELLEDMLSRTVSVTVEANLRLQRVLKLNGCTATDDSGPSEGAKISALACAALDIAAAKFPVISESTWKLLIDAQHHYAESPDEGVSFTPQPQGPDYFEALFDCYEDLSHASLVDLTAVENLETDAALPVYLAANLFRCTKDADLREILSYVSGRPRECVYQGDPNPKDLWRVVRVETVNASVRRVILAFGDDLETMAQHVEIDAHDRTSYFYHEWVFDCLRILPDMTETMKITTQLSYAAVRASERLEEEKRFNGAEDASKIPAL